MEQIEQMLAQARQDGKISETAYQQAQKWLTSSDYADYQADILALIHAGNFTEIENSFYTIIPFGTGGRRGTCGVGPNRINTRTIGESAQGLAAYISRFGAAAKRRGAVIAYDSRNQSKAFAEYTAKVLAGNGVKAYLFSEFRATPELSFAVRELGAMAGVVISASHNPPSDNGFKAYWEDGGQVVPPHDTAIIEEVNRVAALHLMELDQAQPHGLFEYVAPAMDEKYWRCVLNLSLTANRNVRIVYTPLHGAGKTSILPVLQQAGFQDIHVVEEQMTPDGNFPHVKNHFPNPELPAAFEMAMALAHTVDADIGMASDPDADRLGVFFKHHDASGKVQWRLLNGNQVGVLLVDFILRTLKTQAKLPAQGVVVKTLVTSDLTSVIAKDFGMLTVDDLLVGFKYIAEVILNLPPDQEFVFGTEESLGYLRGTFARDKDAAIPALIIAELSAELKAQGKTLHDRLNDIYRKYGCFQEILKDVYVSGAEGVARVARMMEGLRKHPPLTLNGKRVIEVIDRKTGTVIAPETGKIIRQIRGAKGNVLVFILSEDAHTRVTIRPSGTEPKIKYYGAIKKDTSFTMADADLDTVKTGAIAAVYAYVDSLIAEAETRG